MAVKKAIKTSVHDEKAEIAEVKAVSKKVVKEKKVEEAVVVEEAPKKVKKSKKAEEVVVEEEAPKVDEKKVKKSKKIEEVAVVEETKSVAEEKKVKKAKKVEESVVEAKPVEEKKAKKAEEPVEEKKKAKKVEEPVVEEPKKRKADVEASPAAPKKPKVEREEKDPFAVTASDVTGMTEDIKRECRIKTQYVCLKLIGGRTSLKEFEKDLFLNKIKVDSYERALTDGLSTEEKDALKDAVMQLKYKELVRHLQVFTVRPHDNMDMKAVAEATKLVSGMCSKRRAIKYTKKYQSRMQEKKKRGEWDFTRVSASDKKKLAAADKPSVDKQAIKNATKDEPTSEVAKRLALAKDAAKARMKLASMADDDE